MSSPEVDWTLDTLASVVADQPDAHPLRRVDRDDAEIYEGPQSVDMSTPTHERKGELMQANYVGASHVDVASEAIGTEYNHDREAVVGLRVEGLAGHNAEYGHVDPEGNGGVPWRGDTGLVDQIRDALLAERSYPDAGRSNVTYTTLRLANEADQSSTHADYYRWDCDVLLDGYETL